MPGIWNDVKSYSNVNGGQVKAHVVTEEEAGTTVTLWPGNQTREVTEGEVLCQSSRPDQWEVASPDFFDVYSEDGKAAPSESAEDEEFDPSTKTATEVREYLNRDDISDEDRTRVTEAERNGKNRQSAFPA